MNKMCKYIIIVFILLFAFVGLAIQPGQDKKSKDSYSIIIQRNIFSKNRSSQQPVRVEVRPADPNSFKKPDVSFVYILRGVAIDNINKTAFLENQSSREFFQVSTGEQIDDMVIREIKDDRVVFEKAGQKIDIFVGMDLSGVRTVTAPAGAVGSPDSSSSGSDTGSGPSSPSSADEAEIMRKMMERRKQQLGN